MNWRDLGAPTHKPALRFRDGGWVLDYSEPYPLIRCSDWAMALTIAKLTRSTGLLREEMKSPPKSKMTWRRAYAIWAGKR